MSEIYLNYKCQIDEGIWMFFLWVGIFFEFFKQSVMQLFKGDVLVEVIKGEFKELIKGGKILVIIGEGSSVYDMVYLIF